MAKKKKQPSKLVGRSVAEEVRLFAEKHGLSLKLAETLISEHGLNRAKLQEEVEALKIELQFDK